MPVGSTVISVGKPNLSGFGLMSFGPSRDCEIRRYLWSRILLTTRRKLENVRDSGITIDDFAEVLDEALHGKLRT